MIPSIRTFASLILVFAALAAPGINPAYGATFFNRDNVNIDKRIDDDVYVTGGQVDIDKPVNGDLIVMGGNVRVKERIAGSLMVGGGSVNITGNIARSARVAGGSVYLDGRIGRDLLVAGGIISLSDRSKVGGDVLATGGNFTSRAQILGDLKGVAGSAVLNGPIGGNVSLNAERLRLQSKTRVGGNLVYTSQNRIVIASGAKVAGRIRRRVPVTPTPTPAARVLGWLWSLGSMLVVGLLAAWFFPNSLRAAKKSLAGRPWAGLGVGAATLFLAPIAMMFIALTIIGLPLALMLAGSYAALLYLAQIYGASACGALLLDRLTSGERWIGGGVVLGLAILSLIQLVPIVGPLVTFLLILFSAGALVLAVRESLRPPPKPEQLRVAA